MQRLVGRLALGEAQANRTKRSSLGLATQIGDVTGGRPKDGRQRIDGPHAC